MSGRSVFISDRRWRRLDPALRREVLCALGCRALAVQRFACNVCSDLRARGEHALAARLLEALEEVVRG